MKRSVAIVAGALFFLVLLGLLIAKLLFPTFLSRSTTQSGQYAAPVAPNNNPFAQATAHTGTIQSDTPDLTAQTCYRMYLTVIASKYTWDVTKNSNLPEIQQCFTGAFISKWINDIENGNGDFVGGGISADPVLLAQTYSPSWLTFLQARVASRSTLTSDVYLTLGTGAETHQLLVSLVQSTDGQWKINAVQDAVATQ